MPINPLLTAIAAPPIPTAKTWTARYDGSAGPVIDLSQAVPGYPPHPEMLRRLGEAAACADAAGYGPILGDDDLRAVYAAHLSSLYRGAIVPEDLAITAGCNQAFVTVMLALARAGEAVMLPTPWYFNHKMTLDMLGIEARPLPCGAASGFQPDPILAATLIDVRLRAIVLVTPNNPTGAIYSPETIHRFAELCASRGITLVIDETYRDFIAREPTAPHALFEEPSWRASVIQLYSFSKSFCIPGHRAGALVADASVVTEIEKVLDNVQICPGRIAQRALVWAIDALAAWRADNTAEILARADACRSAFAGLPGWSIDSIGAYFAYVRHPFAQPAAAVAERLAAERGVLMLPGPYFGEGQDQHLRIAFANVDAASLGQVAGRLTGPPL